MEGEEEEEGGRQHTEDIHSSGQRVGDILVPLTCTT